LQHFIGYLKDDNQVLQLFFLHARIGTVGLKMERYYFKKQLFQLKQRHHRVLGTLDDQGAQDSPETIERLI
jgi:hypothetical protein